jgi:ribosomal protein L18E
MTKTSQTIDVLNDDLTDRSQKSKHTVWKQVNIAFTNFQWQIPEVMVTTIPKEIQSREEVSKIIQNLF